MQIAELPLPSHFSVIIINNGYFWLSLIKQLVLNNQPAFQRCQSRLFRSAYRSRMPCPVSALFAVVLLLLPLPKAYIRASTYACVHIHRGTINTGAAPTFQVPLLLETAAQTAATAAPRAINTLHMAPAF